MKRILGTVFFLLFAAVACAMGGAPVDSDDAAAVHAAAITSQYRLTNIKTTCLYFDTRDEGSSYLVRVREKHSSVCGGIPETSPTVFFLRLRKRDGDATTTVYNVDGEFQPLRSPAQDKQGARHASAESTREQHLTDQISIPRTRSMARCLSGGGGGAAWPSDRTSMPVTSEDVRRSA